MLTKKDLRDIAAYLNSCTCSFPNKHGYVYNAHPLNVDALDNIWGYKVGFIKLHLRSIGSLTDEEVFTLAEFAFGGEVDRIVDEIRRPHWNGDDPILYLSHFLRTDGSSGHYDYWISERGMFGSGDGSDGSEMATYNEAAVFAYLQSIGVYVPGTINPQYVELQP
jgi:hypothetical protein